MLSTMSPRLKTTIAWTIAITLVVEAVTLYLRFGRGETATEFNKTAPLLLQIHHMFWSVPLFSCCRLFGEDRGSAACCWASPWGS